VATCPTQVSSSSQHEDLDFGGGKGCTVDGLLLHIDVVSGDNIDETTLVGEWSPIRQFPIRGKRGNHRFDADGVGDMEGQEVCVNDLMLVIL
jgi:hypothetical protein